MAAESIVNKVLVDEEWNRSIQRISDFNSRWTVDLFYVNYFYVLLGAVSNSEDDGDRAECD